MVIDVVPILAYFTSFIPANLGDYYTKANTRQLSVHTALILRMKSLQSPFIPPLVFIGEQSTEQRNGSKASEYLPSPSGSGRANKVRDLGEERKDNRALD